MGMLQGKKRSLMGFSITKGSIVDSKSKSFEERLNEVMSTFRKQTELIPSTEDSDQLPKATFKPNVDLSAYYNTPSITKDSSQDVQLLWSLATVIFRSQRQQQQQQQEQQQYNDLLIQQWLRDLVQPGLENQLNRYLKTYGDNDPFVAAFIYLTFGQRKLASEHARQQKDTSLSIYIVHSEFKSMGSVILNQIDMFKSEGRWQNMTVFHRKCWLLVAGRLGYEYDDQFAVTEGIYWQCVVGMYVWFGRRRPIDNKPTLDFYNQVFDKSKQDNIMLKTAKYTDKPDYCCHWFQLLQWWMGDKSLGQLDEWPLDLVWLLPLYIKGADIDPSFSLKWIDQLVRAELAEWAIYATLFLPRPEEKLHYILRSCEWTDEKRLVEEYHIPYKQVQMAKALHAHDSWDFELEYTHLIQGQLYNEAKMALFFFLLPKLFCEDDKHSLKISLKYLDDYSQEDEEIQLLKDIYSYLEKSKVEEDQMVQKTFISKLESIRMKYESRSMKELLKSLMHEIEIK